MAIVRESECGSCGFANPGGHRYCGACGELLAGVEAGAVDGRSARRGELPDEIRTVSVAFADVVDFTKLSALHRLETIKALMDQIFERIYQVVVQHGGTVDKYIGDGVMALFGAPIAYGDDAVRAVRAGLAMQRAMAQLREELQARGLPAVSLRVGINTGSVIAGPVGAGPPRRYTVMGHTVNLASHLQEEAPIHGVLIGEGTYRRVRGLFELRQRGSTATYEVASERQGGLWVRPREVLGAEAEMVGRHEELAFLEELLERSVTESRTELVLVTGPAGVGKTRLAYEFLARVEQRRPEVLCAVGTAHPLTVDVPFGVAADALRSKLHLGPDEDSEAVRVALRSLLAGVGRERPAELELLSRLLGVDDAEEPTLTERPAARQSTELLLSLVDRLSRLRPLVLLVENLQWSDAPSLELVRTIHRRLADRPLLIVALARPELLVDPVALVDGPRSSRLEVGPLSDAAVAELLERVVGPTAACAELVQLVMRHAQGNPYHVEELLRTLEERKVLVRRLESWDLMDLPEELDLPPGIEAVTQARLDHLPPSQAQLLRLAAAVGRVFWDGLLRELAPGCSPLDLSALVRRELVLRQHGSRFRGQQQYRFLHEQTREVAYRMIPEPQRTALHRQIADWLLRQGESSPEELALVGRHLDLGGDRGRASDYLRRAGDAAYGAAAYVAAVQHYGRAIELCEAPARLFELLARRERVLNALGRWAEQRTDAERMVELAEELADAGRRSEALLRLGRALLNLGLHDEAKRALEGAAALAAERGDPEARCRSLRWLAMYHFNRSEHAQAQPLFEEALRVAEGAGLDALSAELAYELGVTVGTLGDYVRALEVSRRALEVFRRQGNRYQESFCLGNLGCFHLYLGEYVEAAEALAAAAELGRELELPLARASAEANLGNVLRLTDRSEASLALERQAEAVAQEIGDLRLAVDAQIYGALAAAELGGEQLAVAETLARRALESVGQAEMPSARAAALMALARALDRQGRLAEALEASADAVSVLEAVGAVEGFETEIRLVHGVLCRRAGREEEARRTLARARQELLQKAERIGGVERRRHFLERVAANVAVLAETPS
ncbi:MAG: AAA family ATPase [Deltaproteobacteria bacterium]|nr:AAA family ATPase [Deltaproteobacteria bacterium]